MTGAIVSREIKHLIWPKLKTAGFKVFTTRSAWRHRECGIDVVNFQSFSRDIADGCGFTTFSFAIRLGWFANYIPPTYPPKVRDGKLLPEGCDFQHSVLRRLAQPEISRHPDVWHVQADGSNLAECIGDAEGLVPEMFRWFDCYTDPSKILGALTGESPSADIGGSFNVPSPNHSYLTGYVAQHLGQMDLARAKLQEAVDSKCYVHLFSSVEGAINRAI